MATLSEMKRDFDRGLYKNFSIDRIMGELTITCEGTFGHETLVDQRTKQPRTFKSYDTAIRAAEQIGFQFTQITSGGNFK